MTWEEIKQTWSDGWRQLAEEAERLYAAAIREDPAAFKDDAEKYLAELKRTRTLLDEMKGQIPKHPKTPEEKQMLLNWFDLDDRYHELAAGFYSDAEVQQTTQLGIIPVLIVAGIAIGVAATSWAVASYEHAVNLREQTELAARELDARIEASKEGRTLQPTTLPALPADSTPSPLDLLNPKAAAKGLGQVLVGALVVGAGVLLLPQVLKRK